MKTPCRAFCSVQQTTVSFLPLQTVHLGSGHDLELVTRSLLDPDPGDSISVIAAAGRAWRAIFKPCTFRSRRPTSLSVYRSGLDSGHHMDAASSLAGFFSSDPPSFSPIGLAGVSVSIIVAGSFPSYVSTTDLGDFHVLFRGFPGTFSGREGVWRI